MGLKRSASGNGCPSTGLGGACTEAQTLGMTTVYDTDVLIAVDRNDRNVG